MSDNRGGLAGGLSGGLKLAAVALLVHQLMKHAQAGSQAEQPAAVPETGVGQASGGLGGILGGLFGGGASGGGGLGGALGGLLGGLGGLLAGARQHGLAPQVDSWVGTGQNLAPSPQQLEPMFDPAAVDAAAQHAGTDRGTLLSAVAEVMPGLVDRLTPDGRLPQSGASVDPALALRGMLGGKGPDRA